MPFETYDIDARVVAGHDDVEIALACATRWLNFRVPLLPSAENLRPGYEFEPEDELR